MGKESEVDYSHREEVLTFVREFLKIIGLEQTIRISSTVYGIEVSLKLKEDGSIFIY